LFASDILKVLYAPHKVFKQIIQNPKYWGPILILILFASLQTGLFFAQYSRTEYERTSPAIGQLTSWTDNTTLWTVPSGIAISSNYLDIMNTTFYGNSSIQFDLLNSNNISVTISNFGSPVNCGPTGFPELYIQIKIVQPATAPSGAKLQLFSQDASNYFQSDLTSSISNMTAGSWYNFTIPVGSGNWQSIGDPDWSKITGLNLTVTFPENSNTILRIGGLFLRGLYSTPIQDFGTAGFAASAIFSGFFSFVIQWIALSVVFFLLMKLLKGPVTWKPLFVSIAFALVTMVVETLIILVATLAMPAQIHYPFEFAYSYQVSYAPQFVAVLSSASQTVYNSTIAPSLATLTLITTIVAIATYVWITLIGSTVVRAITSFPWSKSILASAASVVLAYIILSLLAAFGIV
jgi:hypothetical protein